MDRTYTQRRGLAGDGGNGVSGGAGMDALGVSMFGNAANGAGAGLGVKPGSPYPNDIRRRRQGYPGARPPQPMVQPVPNAIRPMAPPVQQPPPMEQKVLPVQPAISPVQPITQTLPYAQAQANGGISPSVLQLMQSLYGLNMVRR